jgi:lipopolysaccharide export system ATP-binding protein
MMKLEAQDLEKKYGGRKVVDHVKLEANIGEVVGLLGPNGAGKTTIFYMIVGLVAPGNGDIYLDNKRITGFPMYKRARMGMSYLPQEPSVFRKLTVEENLLAVMEAVGRTAEEKSSQIQSLMTELNISHLARNKAYTLSGGERRRVEIARALINNPKFLLLDEPFAGIDPIAIKDIQEIVIQLKAKKIGILITDHNVRETLQITDRAYLISDGRILLEGSSYDIINNSKAREIYLGETFRLHHT